MLFGNRKRNESLRVEVIQTTRDLIEIVAIILAGTWAIYVFVYENKVKPNLAAPEVSFSAHMEAGAAHNGLVPIRIATVLKNTGTVQAHLLSFSITVVGSSVRPSAGLNVPRVRSGLNTLLAFYTLQNQVPVYRIAWLTHASDPKIQTDLLLRPGQAEEGGYLTYIPQHRFDRLSLTVVTDFTKDDSKPIPVRMAIGPGGVPQFSWDEVPGREVDQISTQVAFLDVAGL